jgi:uncharacterized protein (UPF0332 family)
MSEEIKKLLDKARKSLESARLLLKNGYGGFAASRAYYAMFYVAEAFLLSKGLTYSSHSATIANFGFEFVKTKKVDSKFHRYLIEGSEQRQIGDYETTDLINDEAASEIIKRAEEFLSLGQKII